MGGFMRTWQIIALLFISPLAGCSSLNTIQQAEYQMMQTEGLLVEEKNPTLAACLGILPGGGSFYTGNYVLGAVDLVTWPLSVCWDPIAGYNQARVLNYQASRSSIDRMKNRQLRELTDARDDGRVTQAQYIQEKRNIESKYGFD